MLPVRTVFAVLTPLALAGPALSWDVSTIDTVESHSAGEIGLDGNGRPAIALCGEDVTYAVWDGSTWVREIAWVSRKSTTTRCTLAFDGSGEPAIAAYDGTALALRVARRRAGVWTMELVDSRSRAGQVNAIARDSNGQVAVVYTHGPTASESVELARSTPAGWSYERVADGVDIDGVDLTFDPAGAAVIALADPAAAKIARRDTGGWTLETLVRGTPTLAIDALGRPAVALADSVLRIARHDGLAWRLEDVDMNGATVSSLAFDGAGHPVIAYQQQTLAVTEATLQVARWNGGMWLRETADATLNSGNRTSLAIDAAGNEWILHSLEDPTPPGSRVTRRDSGFVSVDVASREVLQLPSLALQPSAAPVVVYAVAHGDLKELRLAERAGTSWTLERIPTAADASWGAVGIDGSGWPVVAYIEAGASRLEVARRVAGVWSAADVADASPYGVPALVVDATGSVLVAYVGATGATIELAREVMGAWSTEVAYGDIGTLQSPSLALQPGGLPAVAYGLLTPRDIGYARYDGSSWRSEVLPSLGSDWNPSLAFDLNGLPAIAFHASSSPGIALSRFNGGAWQTELVDGPGDTSNGPTLAFSPAGEPVIASFAAYTESWLRITRPCGARWSTELVQPSANSRPAFVLDGAGEPTIAFLQRQTPELRLLEGPGFTTLLGTLVRGSVSDLTTSDWKLAALPLSETNDDESAPFPVCESAPTMQVDPIVTSAPLTLYRRLRSGGAVIRTVRVEAEVYIVD